MPTPNRYCIYPSLLDAFQDYLDSELLWGQFWGSSEEPQFSHEEFAAQCEKKLIDQINRCPKEPIEAADKGTAFNAVVDMLNGYPVEPPTIILQSDENVIVATINNFTFTFATPLCRAVAERFKGAICQYRCEATLHTAKGDVTLYGFLDEWQGCKISDLKTTKGYQFGKYERKWQRHVYPFAVVESGDCTEIKEFEYTAVKLSNPTEMNPVITGEIYPETYTYDHEQSWLKLQDGCERFIDWLESRREFITDNRIFGGVNPDGYAGVPVDMNLLLPHKDEVEYEEVN